MGELNNVNIDKEVKTIRRLVPELFLYLDEAARIVEELKNSAEIPEEALKALYMAWQYQKSRIKAQQAERRKEYKSREREELELLKHVSQYHKESRDSGDAQSVQAPQPSTLCSREEERENPHRDSHRQGTGKGLVGAAGRASTLGAVQPTETGSIVPLLPLQNESYPNPHSPNYAQAPSEWAKSVNYFQAFLKDADYSL